MINTAQNKYKIPFHNTWVRLHKTKSHTGPKPQSTTRSVDELCF